MPVVGHFFESFPNGWDQAEYAWCVKAGYLPHSPYVLFILLGRLLHLALPPAAALATISALSGLVALPLLAGLVDRLGRPDARIGWAAALLLAGTPVFVRHATTQEVYALQLALLLVTAWLLRAPLVPWGVALAGLAYGAAFATHNSSIFLLPALAALAWAGPDRHGSLRVALAFAAGAAVPVSLVYGSVLSSFPAEPGTRAQEVAVYLRGMPPGFAASALLDPGFALDSIRGLLTRLGDGAIPVTRGPMATGPVGLSWLHAVAVALGAVSLQRRNRLAALFWVLWMGPFIVYELALGWNLDYGTYLVFLLPPICALAAECVADLNARLAAVGPALAGLLLAALLAPGVSQIARHWGDPAEDRRLHASPATLAAVWAADALPPNAIVVQPRDQWNANLTPLYAARQHIARIQGALRLFRDRGPGTPMKPDAYTLLTTSSLRALLREGRPIFAFERDPLRGGAPDLDPAVFRWTPVAEVDLATASERLGIEPEWTRRPGARVVYQASVSPSR